LSREGTGLRVLVIAASVVVLVGLPPPAAAAAAGMRLTPNSGPPTTQTAVAGRGFGSSERVDIRFDSTPVARATTSVSGTFSTSFAVPAAALPGIHTVLARGKTSHLTAHASFQVRTDWPKFHFDLANSGANPYENVLGPANVATLQLAWKRPAGVPGGAIVETIAVAGGVAYAGASGTPSADYSYISAFSAQTGSLLWRVRQSIGAASGVAVADGTLYAGGGDDRALHAYDAVSGTSRWTFYASGIVNTPTVASGVVYVGASDQNLYAVDATSGTKLWTFHTSNVIVRAPAVAGGVVFFGSADDKVYAVDAVTGQKKWSTSTGAEVATAPAVVGGVVYAGSSDDNLYALDAMTGSVLWTAPTGGPVTSSPAVADGVVYVGSDDDNLYAFDAATGAEMWHAPTGAAVFPSPFVANGVVYVGSDDHSLYAIDAASGQILWSYATQGVPGYSGAVVDGRVYTGSQDGYLYAFGLP
jgi:outer membrane protein assembly factor BamB